MYTHDEMETAEQLRPEVTCSHQTLLICNNVRWDTFSLVPCETSNTHETSHAAWCNRSRTVYNAITVLNRGGQNHWNPIFLYLLTYCGNCISTAISVFRKLFSCLSRSLIYRIAHSRCVPSNLDH